ncbi:LysE family translocator [Enterobacter roggenkampii]|nr:LysE family translocator [Enterobacter roggenkampii]
MINTLILYGISSLAVTVIPGPTMLLALSNGTTKNKKTILMGVLGAACSDFILIGLVALGLGAIMAASETLFLLIKIVGVIYLFWLAYTLWHSTPERISIADKNYTHPKIAFYRSLFAALSNPKGLLFFGAFLPQFIDTYHSLVQQYSSFIFITIMIDVVIMVCYATAGFQISRYLTTAKIKIMNRICSIVMIFMASGLALYRRVS